jgi:hypothetical protein
LGYTQNRTMTVELAYRPDVIVNDQVIVELKTVTAFLPVHEAQILTYLRLSGIRIGLLINFHAIPFKSGIKRFIVCAFHQRYLCPHLCHLCGRAVTQLPAVIESPQLLDR